MLAGPPDRTSAPLIEKNLQSYDGFIKLRLGHQLNGSVLVPDQLMANIKGWRYYQPSFFGPCLLCFNVEPGIHHGRFSLDVGRPRAKYPTRVIIKLSSDGFVKSYMDGAQLYRCTFDAPKKFWQFAAGRCQFDGSSEFTLDLFHHTDFAARAEIRSSAKLLSSAWNLRGNKKLVNVAYAYLSSLPEIKSESDLRRIAMASDGTINFQTTSNRVKEEVVELTVYREATRKRKATLKLGLPTSIIAPPHLLLHKPPDDDAYYEVIVPEIFRVGLKPGKFLNIKNDVLFANSDDLKSFSYVVMGSADESEGIKAPYDEEHTSMIMHLEQLTDDVNVFETWNSLKNSDQMSGRVIVKKY